MGKSAENQWPFLKNSCASLPEDDRGCVFTLVPFLRQYFGGISPYIAQKHGPYMVGTSNQSVPVAWPLNIGRRLDLAEKYLQFGQRCKMSSQLTVNW